MARPYERVSHLDRDDRENDTTRSTDAQHVDNARVADEQGWLLGTRLVDDDRSASRYARRAREGYDHLIAELEADTFGAQVLILWESSRGSRTVLEWVLLLDLLERRGVLVHVTTHCRTYDPRNGRDRRTLLEDAVDSEYEVSKNAGRIKRGHAMNAKAGKPHNKPFGYARDYLIVNGKSIFKRQYPDPDEAPVVRELFDRLQAGHSLHSIRLDFAERGIRTRNGNPFANSVLRGIARNPAYAALREHDGTLIEGDREIWEPIISRAQFEAVREIFAARTQTHTRPGRGVHLLTGIAVCDECDSPLSFMKQKGRPDMYRCLAAGHVRVDYAELNKLAELLMIGFLADERNIDRFRRDDHNRDAELAAAKDNVAAINAELDELARKIKAGLDEWVAATKKQDIDERLEAARARERELSVPPALNMLPPGEDVADRWADAPMSTRREVARVLLAPEILGELRITRAPVARHSAPIHERITWRTER